MPSTFQSKPVLDVSALPINWDQVNAGQLDDNTFDAQGLGVETPWKSTTRVRRKVRLPFILETRAKITAMRQFIVSRGTRRDCFWCPLMLNDYGLTRDASSGDSIIYISNIGLTDKFTYGEQFRYLALVNFDKFECYEIQLVEDLGDEEKITLTTTLATDLEARGTNCVGLMLARLADDNNEFSFKTDSVATISLNIVELPSEFDGSTTSAPVYLYRVTRGETVWRFTSWPDSGTPNHPELTLVVASNGTVDDLTWYPADIDHGEFTQDSEFRLQPLKITVATDDTTSPFRSALDRTISEVTTIEIYETDFSTRTVDMDAPVFKGRMGKCTFGEKGQIEIELSTILRIGEQKVPTVMVQRPCNNRLFDQFCTLSPTGRYKTGGTITAVNADPPYIEADEFGTKSASESDNNWFALGKVTIGNETRLCTGTGVSGSRLYLNAPFVFATVGQTVAAYAGCDKRMTTCNSSKFDNAEHFMGFPVIPNKEPQFEQLSKPLPTGGKK